MMKLLIASAALIAVAGLSFPPAANAAPNFGRRDQFIGNWCGSHPGAGQCNDWRNNHGHWRDSDYRGFYRSNQDEFPAVAAGLFGFAAGAAIASSNADDPDASDGSDDSDHVAACSDAYKSYQARSDTYLGYDGVRHQCNL